MWNTRSATECGNPSTCRAASSGARSSTHATGSACAPLPRRSSITARDGDDTESGSGSLSAARRKILLFQNAAMMQLVPGDDVSDPAHRDFVLVGDAAPHP